MQIDWSLFQPVDVGSQISQGFNAGRAFVRESQTQNALRALVENPDDPNAQNALAAFSPDYALQLAGQRSKQAAASRERERMGAVLSQFDTDPAGARRAALESGDIDLAKQLSELSGDHQKQLHAMYTGAAPLAYQAMKLPYEQRKPYIDGLRPQLNAAGWTDQQIDAFDPTDANLGGIVQSSMTLEQAMGRDQINYKEVGPGARLVPFDATGRPVAGTDAPQPVENPAASRQPATSLDLQAASALGSRFGRVTSTSRTPEHNRAVGGVPNSYHLSGHAIDIARAPGVSHAQIEKAYREAGYTVLESLDEGDHSHLALSGGGGSSNEATVRQQAEEAIRAGADPAAVKARARSMGVDL